MEKEKTEIKTIDKQDFKIVGMELRTTVQECQKVLPGLWQKFLAKSKNIQNKKNEIHYGLCFEEDKESCSFRYIAGVEVEEFGKVPKSMVKIEVPKSKYAVFTHKGPLSTLSETYCKIYEKIMPKSGLKQKDVCFELYDERYKREDNDSEIDIYVAIV